ncbi:hypothetical protein AZI86_08805 [Bdellovibrio bacteriovorus]|uniref:Uncharacterized protein n=2 Tax=Bdellovibrio bacteriovorus TaxID=959 RepID=A0A150WRG7_BDEBC|nr:hypothetical protein AZI86_08805 [Bdellovibrio bacteriovorus]
MKIAMNLRHWGLIFLAVLVCGPAWALDNFKEFKRDHLDAEAATNFFYSEANYPQDGGSITNLPNGNHYQLLDVTLGTRYVPKRSWSVFGWANIGNAESKDSLATRSNSSLSEAAIGADFLMYSEAFQLIPEFTFVMPFEKINPSSDNVPNSEGVMEFRSRLIAQMNLGTSRPYGWLGFTYRAEGRSFLMPWGVGLQFKLSSLVLGAELFGYQSVSDDTDSSALRTAYINSVNAGSLKFYGKNPSLMDSQVYGTWNINRKWSLQANGGVTLTGSNSAAGYHVGGFLRYSFDFTEGYLRDDGYTPMDSDVPGGRSQMYDRSDSMTSEKVRDFREETEDGVDQNLFKPKPTPKKRINDKQLQQQLDQTEFQVELRSNKKKKRKK